MSDEPLNVSNHHPLNCLFNCVSMLLPQKNPRITYPLWGNFTCNRRIPYHSLIMWKEFPCNSVIIFYQVSDLAQIKITFWNISLAPFSVMTGLLRAISKYGDDKLNANAETGLDVGMHSMLKLMEWDKAGGRDLNHWGMVVHTAVSEFGHHWCKRLNVSSVQSHYLSWN